VSERAFSPLPTEIDLPVVEREILQRWRDTDVFRRSPAQTADGPR
jgi:isoleucyl-tRNA synthetase